MSIEFSSSDNPKHNKARRRPRPTYKNGTRTDGATVVRYSGMSRRGWKAWRNGRLAHVGDKQAAKIAAKAA